MFLFPPHLIRWFPQIRDMGQEPCGRLSFLKEPKSSKGLPQIAVCNLNITLPTHKKVGCLCLTCPSLKAICHTISKSMNPKQEKDKEEASFGLEATACCLYLLLVFQPVIRPHNVHIHVHIVLCSTAWFSAKNVCKKRMSLICCGVD